jgi:uncharacterized protein YkwD
MLLKNKIVWVVTALLIVGGLAWVFWPQPTPVRKGPAPIVTPAPASQYVAPVAPTPAININDLWQDVNNARTQNGLPALVLNTSLDESAQAKCSDMVTKNYWAHNSPDGLTPWDFIGKYTTYTHAGENLEYGSPTSQGVVTAWLNSPEHKANIMDSGFIQEGFGICKFRGTDLVVEHFTN